MIDRQVLLARAARRVARTRVDPSAADEKDDTVMAALLPTIAADEDPYVAALAEPEIVRAVVSAQLVGPHSNSALAGAQRPYVVLAETPASSRRLPEPQGGLDPDLTAKVLDRLRDLVPALLEEIVAVVAEEGHVPLRADLRSATGALRALHLPNDSAVRAALGAYLSPQGVPMPPKGRTTATRTDPNNDPPDAEQEQPAAEQPTQQVGKLPGKSVGVGAEDDSDDWFRHCVSPDYALAGSFIRGPGKREVEQESIEAMRALAYCQVIGRHLVNAVDLARLSYEKGTLDPSFLRRAAEQMLFCWRLQSVEYDREVNALSRTVLGAGAVAECWARYLQALAYRDDHCCEDNNQRLQRVRVAAESIRWHATKTFTPYVRMQVRCLHRRQRRAQTVLEVFGDDLWEVLGRLDAAHAELVMTQLEDWNDREPALSFLLAPETATVVDTTPSIAEALLKA
jgi:hypothetical protein